ncbi:MAG: hypothetical protein IJ497_08650 [Clostridia bacterium]|nr:hypothetical protein [Clostridia bacterium]
MARWSIIRDGRAIAWDVKKGDVHTDDVEMAGFYAADTVTYGMTEDGFKLMHRPTFPTLRLRPNNTHATYQLNVPDANVPKVVVNGEIAEEVLTRVEQNGILTLCCTDEKHGLEIVHTCYPSTDWRITYEAVTVRNTGDCDVDLTVTVGDNEVNQTMGPMGINIMDVITDFEDGNSRRARNIPTISSSPDASQMKTPTAACPIIPIPKPNSETASAISRDSPLP